MYFCHSAAIWAAFPALVPGVMLVEGVRPDAQALPLLEPLFEQARARLAATPESAMPEVQAWRQVFGQMGLKPTQYRSAAEALLRRFRKEGALPSLHPLVDACNAASLAFALPVAVLDLDHVAGFLEVRQALGDEVYLSFGGEIEHPEPGEVIFADAEGHAHARRWVFRQSRQSTVGAATRRALIVCEGQHAGAAQDVPALLGALAGVLDALGMRSTPPAVLRADAPRWQPTP
ncbi:hypothetical protein F8S13_21510 [Chloroflexia bacterium SDU3-3]|nr:hypothetical protein F8S13_21510 [Chloroflexia bacterium SDU3-3]